MENTTVKPLSNIADVALIQRGAERFRFNYLDGLRGMAAATVLFGHIFSLATFENGKISQSLPPLFLRFTQWMSNVHYAVAVFIVLSGFCLMLPVKHSKNRDVPGGLLGFLRRRARRILPPYYAALLIVVGALVISHRFFLHVQGTAADTSLGNVVTHVLLIHNLFQPWAMALDIPMWSVAWECQIYLLFVLILLPIWRRFGTACTLASSFALGYLPGIVLPERLNLDWTSPWYLGLFALGMATAEVACSSDSEHRWAKMIVWQNTVLITILIGFIMLAIFKPAWLDSPSYRFLDVAVAIFTSCLILVCDKRTRCDWLQRMFTRILESRWMMIMGAFSYSLYLVHYPILQKIQNLLHGHQFSHFTQLAVLGFVGAPLSLIMAYCFHLVFERPFMPGKPKK